MARFAKCLLGLLLEGRFALLSPLPDQPHRTPVPPLLDLGPSSHSFRYPRSRTLSLPPLSSVFSRVGSSSSSFAPSDAHLGRASKPSPLACPWTKERYAHLVFAAPPLTRSDPTRSSHSLACVSLEKSSFDLLDGPSDQARATRAQVFCRPSLSLLCTTTSPFAHFIVSDTPHGPLNFVDTKHGLPLGWQSCLVPLSVLLQLVVQQLEHDPLPPSVPQPQRDARRNLSFRHLS